MDNFEAIYHQTLAVIPICLNEFAMGVGSGWVAPTIKKLLQDPTGEIVPTVEECSWIAALGEFGRTFGPIFSIFLVDNLGRKLMIQIGAATFLIMWLAIIFTRSVLIICIARFAYGLSVGMCDVISSIYLGENCSPKNRGIFCSATLTCFYLGILVEYVLATYLSYNIVAIVNLIIVVGCLLSTLLLIESPQFLMLKERYEEAEDNLMWLNGTVNKTDVSSEFEIIKSNITSEKMKKTSYKKLLSTPANYRSIITVIILNILQAATGSSVIFNYAPIIFPSTKILTSDEFTICFGFIQLLSAVLSALVIEKYNRRTLTLLSFATFTLCHSVIAVLYRIDESNSLAEYIPWIIFFLICTYASFSAMMDSVVHIIRGELFPQSIKPFGSGLSIIVLSFTGFITIKIFLMIKDTYGIYVNFVLYAVVSLIAFWFNYFKLPETRGKTLIDIQKSLEKRK